MRIAAFAFAVAALALPTMPSAAQPQPWPQRPVKFILPLGPGSGVDIGARLIADRLSQKWGQPVVVENRPGGDGIVAITAFISAHDSHTLLLGPASSFSAHPYLHDKMPYDPNELAPVARVSATLGVIGVPPSLNVNSLKELFALARAQPGKLNWATIGSSTDFLVAGYLKAAGIDMVKIPYRDLVQGMNDVAEGRLQLYFASYAIMRPQVQAGRIKLVAVAASQPTSILPGVPTVAQEGFPELTIDGLVGLYGPRDMPAELREQIAADVKTVLADDTIVSRFGVTGQVVMPGSPAEFAAAIGKQQADLAAVAKVLGITAAH